MKQLSKSFVVAAMLVAIFTLSAFAQHMHGNQAQTMQHKGMEAQHMQGMMQMGQMGQHMQEMMKQCENMVQHMHSQNPEAMKQMMQNGVMTTGMAMNDMAKNMHKMMQGVQTMKQNEQMMKDPEMKKHVEEMEKHMNEMMKSMSGMIENFKTVEQKGSK